MSSHLCPIEMQSFRPCEFIQQVLFHLTKYNVKVKQTKHEWNRVAFSFPNQNESFRLLGAKRPTLVVMGGANGLVS